MKTLIAVKNENQKTFAVEADLIEIHGITCGIHRSVRGNGWACTAVGVGVALAVLPHASKADVITLATERVEKHGVASVQAKLAELPLCPAVETLPRWEAPVKTKATLADIASILDAIHNTVPLTDRERTAVYRALNSRTGQLKAKAPSAFGDADERLAAAAWQGLQPNAFKVGLVSCFAIGHHEESRALWQKLSAVRWPAAFDKDKLALVNAGVW